MFHLARGNCCSTAGVQLKDQHLGSGTLDD
jgi:hypothetical protein